MMSAKPTTTPISNQFSIPEEPAEIFSLLKYLPDAFILTIHIEGIIQVADHYEFILRILGRSRFCGYLPELSSFVPYTCRVRYNNLKKLHDSLEKYFATRLVQFHEPCQMPAFPGKVWFSSAKKVAEGRVVQFNKYFEEMFANFGAVAIFAEPLIEFFAPFSAEILVIAESKKERNDYLNTIIRKLFNKGVENKQSTSTTSTLEDSFLMSVIGSLKYVKKNLDETIYKPFESPADFSWKRHTPFDYVCNDNLFRIEFVNLHFPSKTPVKTLLGYAPNVIIVLDMSLKDCLNKLKKTLLLVAEHSKDKTHKIGAVVVVGTNSEFSNKIMTKDELEKYAASILGKACAFKYTECSVMTGEGVLESLDVLLKLYK